MASVEAPHEEIQSGRIWSAVSKALGRRSPIRARMNDEKFDHQIKALDLMPLDQRVTLAFQAVPLKSDEKVVIEALMRYPESNSNKLSQICGWAGSIWYIHFAAICQKRISWLIPCEFQDQTTPGFVYGALVEYRTESATFKFKPEVLAAFRKMGLGA